MLLTLLIAFLLRMLDGSKRDCMAEPTTYITSQEAKMENTRVPQSPSKVKDP